MRRFGKTVRLNDISPRKFWAAEKVRQHGVMFRSSKPQKQTNQVSMKKTLLLMSALALLPAAMQQAEAAGTSGYSNGFYYFTYYTGNGSTTIHPNGGNYSANWTSGLSDS